MTSSLAVLPKKRHNLSVELIVTIEVATFYRTGLVAAPIAMWKITGNQFCLLLAS